MGSCFKNTLGSPFWNFFGILSLSFLFWGLSSKSFFKRWPLKGLYLRHMERILQRTARLDSYWQPLRCHCRNSIVSSSSLILWIQIWPWQNSWRSIPLRCCFSSCRDCNFWTSGLITTTAVSDAIDNCKSFSCFLECHKCKWMTLL